MAELTSETTPLLGSENNPTTQQEPNAGSGETLPASVHFRAAIRILTIVLIVSSLLCLASLLAAYLSIILSPYLGHGWRPMEFLGPLSSLVLVAFVLAVLNYLIWIPMGFNIVIDIFLAMVILVVASSIDYYLPGHYLCDRSDYDGKPKPIDPRCLEAKHRVMTLMVVGAILGIVIGVSHLILFVLRSVAVVRTKFWEQPTPFRFPGGQLSFEFTIKLLRQDRAGASADNAALVGAAEGE